MRENEKRKNDLSNSNPNNPRLWASRVRPAPRDLKERGMARAHAMCLTVLEGKAWKSR